MKKQQGFLMLVPALGVVIAAGVVLIAEHFVFSEPKEAPPIGTAQFEHAPTQPVPSQIVASEAEKRAAQ